MSVTPYFYHWFRVTRPLESSVSNLRKFWPQEFLEWDHLILPDFTPYFYDQYRLTIPLGSSVPNFRTFWPQLLCVEMKGSNYHMRSNMRNARGSEHLNVIPGQYFNFLIHIAFRKICNICTPYQPIRLQIFSRHTIQNIHV